MPGNFGNRCEDPTTHWRREREAFAALRAKNPIAWTPGSQALAVVLLFAIGWPVAILGLVLFGVGYAKPYVPERLWRFPLRQSLAPLVLLLVAVTYPLYNGSLGTMRILGHYPGTGPAVIMCVS